MDRNRGSINGHPLPVRERSLVEVRGRLFTGADGHAYVRPRMHPYEPDPSPQLQAREDTTPFRMRVTGPEIVEQKLAHPEGSWHTIRGVLRGTSIEVTEVFGQPAQWLDTWEEADPRYAESNPDAPTEWFLSPDRQTLLEEISDRFDQRTDFGPHLSWGLNGTYEGTFRVKLYMLMINDNFASWANNYSPDDLLVRSFVMAL